MTEFKYPLATSSWDEREYAAIDRVIASDRFTMGREVAEFETEFAALVGSKHAVMVNSGSSANLLMIAALIHHSNYALRPGDEVLVPAVSWSTTYTPLHQYGLCIRFVDIDAQTLNIDLEALENAISDKTRMLFSVNLLGNPVNYDKIRPILEEYDVLLIEDNCESLGATLGGRHAGTFGIAGSFSCFFSHHISTMEGGVVVTDDEELYHLMLSMRAHGWTRELPYHNQVTGTKSYDNFRESFRFVLPGYNLRPLEISGAIGRSQIQKVPLIVRERRLNAERFKSVMRDRDELQIQQETGESSWFGFSMIIKDEVPLERATLARSLQAAGIECRPIVAGCFARSEVVTKFMDYSIHGELNRADHLDRNGLFIGNHHYALDNQMELLSHTLTDLFME